MPRTKTDLLQGTLELLILRVLSEGPMHGWGIAHRIEDLSEETLLPNQGSLYPALQRLEREGRVSARWGTSANNRRAKYYELTRAGRARLGQETERWDTFASAVYRILDGRL